MLYVAIFAAAYVAVFVFTFALLTSKIGRAASHMLATGVSRDDVDKFHAEMRGPTIRGALQATVITGTALGAVVSGIVWALA